jgi:hypothetical protein
MSARLKTTGNLRAFLLKAIEDVESGKMDAGRANSIVKIAAQVNASLLAEVEVARIAFQTGRPSSDLSNLSLGMLPEPDGKQIELQAEPRPAVAARPLSPAARVIDRRVEGSVNFGDPVPGRSALDQRARSDG